MDQQEAMNAGRWLTHPEGTTLPSHSMMGIFAFFRPDQGSCWRRRRVKPEGRRREHSKTKRKNHSTRRNADFTEICQTWEFPKFGKFDKVQICYRAKYPRAVRQAEGTLCDLSPKLSGNDWGRKINTGAKIGRGISEAHGQPAHFKRKSKIWLASVPVADNTDGR